MLNLAKSIIFILCSLYVVACVHALIFTVRSDVMTFVIGTFLAASGDARWTEAILLSTLSCVRYGANPNC